MNAVIVEWMNDAFRDRNVSSTNSIKACVSPLYFLGIQLICILLGILPFTFQYGALTKYKLLFTYTELQLKNFIKRPSLCIFYLVEFINLAKT